jgi:hypothetical protein
MLVRHVQMTRLVFVQSFNVQHSIFNAQGDPHALEDFATVAAVIDRLHHTASYGCNIGPRPQWIGPQTREDGKMRVVQTRACTNRIHDSERTRAVTYKLCTLEYGKKAPRCAVISLSFSFIKGY